MLGALAALIAYLIRLLGTDKTLRVDDDLSGFNVGGEQHHFHNKHFPQYLPNPYQLSLSSLSRISAHIQIQQDISSLTFSYRQPLNRRRISNQNGNIRRPY